MDSLKRDNTGDTRWLMVKVTVIVVALGGALFLFLRGGSETVQTDAPASAVSYLCPDDGHLFKVTPAGFEQLEKNGDIRSPDPVEGTGVLMIRCPKCRQIRAVRAVRCPADQSPLARRLPDGQPGRCPTCGWSFYKR